MELNKMIEDLIASGIIENRELAVTLLNADDITPEEKWKYVNVFVKEYTERPDVYFDEEHKALFKAWVDVYRSIEKDQVINRVKKIE